MKTTIWIFFLLAAFAQSLTVSAQIADTNLLHFQFVGSNGPAAISPMVSAQTTNSKRTDLIPLVEMSGVPITAAIENLARQAGINYLIDPALFPLTDADGNRVPEPIINCKFKLISAENALDQILNEHNLVLIDDPVSTIAAITTNSQTTNALFAGLSSAETNPLFPHTNTLPLIMFEDVPISTGIENLARQENESYTIDPKLSQEWLGHEPTLNIRLENITGWNALNRILNVRNLVLVEDPVSHVARITHGDEPLPNFDASLFGISTNNPPPANNPGSVIYFSDAPLDTILINLAQKSSLHITLDPRITQAADLHTGGYPYLPTVSLHWTGITPAQALVALCKNYDLIAIKHPSTGAINIEPAPKHQK